MARAPKSLLNPLTKPMPSGGRGTNVQTLLPSVLKAGEGKTQSDEWEDSAWRYGSKEALRQALADKGPGAYVIGVRPLRGHEDRFKDEPADSWADKHNLEWLHEHLFYLDADGNFHHVGNFDRNRKTGEAGGIKFDVDDVEDKKWMGTVDEYHFGPILDGGDITREKLQPEGFGPDDYNLFMNNCQDYIDELRHSALISGKAPQE